MKGVILRKDDKKSIVLFNNGSFGAIPASSHYEVGMVVSVSCNKKRIVIAISLACAFLAAFFFLAQFWYLTPAGYLRISREAVIEVAYNRAKRIRAVRPLNAEAVPIAAELNIKHQSVIESWERIISAFGKTGYLAEGSVEVFVAQDNLNKAKDLQSALLVSSEHLRNTAFPELNARFSLYTMELYQKATTEQMPPVEGMRHGNMMMHGMNGMNGNWRWRW